MIKNLLLDMDGTLIDSPKIALDTFVKFLDEKKLKAPQEKIMEIMYRGHSILLKEILDMNKRKYSDEMREELRTEYIRRIRKVRLYPYVIELLEAIKGKLTIVLATMSSDKTAQVVLEENDLNKYFDYVITRDTHNIEEKTDLLASLLKDLNAKGEECILIEDSQYGIDAGKSLGIKTIAVRNTTKDIKGDFTVDNLNQARNIIIKEISEGRKNGKK
jgi:HAD superfamily hydrolase (TIGR01509 family)